MNNGDHMKIEAQIEAVKGVPAVAGTVYSAITLNEAVAVVTLIYVTLQIIYLLWKWRKEARDRT